MSLPQGLGQAQSRRGQCWTRTWPPSYDVMRAGPPLGLPAPAKMADGPTPRSAAPASQRTKSGVPGRPPPGLSLSRAQAKDPMTSVTLGGPVLLPHPVPQLQPALGTPTAAEKSKPQGGFSPPLPSRGARGQAKPPGAQTKLLRVLGHTPLHRLCAPKEWAAWGGPSASRQRVGRWEPLRRAAPACPCTPRYEPFRGQPVALSPLAPQAPWARAGRAAGAVPLPGSTGQRAAWPPDPMEPRGSSPGAGTGRQPRCLSSPKSRSSREGPARPPPSPGAALAWTSAASQLPRRSVLRQPGPSGVGSGRSPAEGMPAEGSGGRRGGCPRRRQRAEAEAEPEPGCRQAGWSGGPGAPLNSRLPAAAQESWAGARGGGGGGS